MKNKTNSYWEPNPSILDDIDYRTTDDSNGFQVGQQVRIGSASKMLINDKMVDVTVTHFAVIVAVNKDSVTVNHKGKKRRVLMSDIAEMNKQLRSTHSAWKTFRDPRDIKPFDKSVTL
jgi:hypothetical protein